MYQISCDGFILHDVRLDKKYRVIDPCCELELNTAGKLTFKIPPSHPYYDKIKKLSSVVTLTQDSEWIFSGRVLNDEVDFRNIKTIEVEGELSYLVDSNQRVAEYHNISVADYFSAIIAKHNAMVEEKKRFKVGLVTVTDPNDSLYRFSNYEKTLPTIQDKLINRLGGYLRIRHTSEGRVIDYIADYENVNNQEINFGKNLLDLTKYVQGETIATAIIPLGARLEKSETEVISEEGGSEEGGSEERLTIKSVNNGLDYVYDEEAVALYGWIFDTVVWDDVTTAGSLLSKAQKELASRRLLSIRLELNAIDLHLLDVDIERIKLGDKIKVVSEPHGVNQYMIVSSMTINIDDPAQNSICLGSSVTSLTDITNNDGIRDKVEETFKDYGITNVKQELKHMSSEITRQADNILMQVSETYATKDDVSAVNAEFSTQMQIQSNSIDFRFSTFKNETDTINGIITSNQQLLEEYIRFQGALIELGKVGNSLVAKLSNDKLAFLEDGLEIAYISNKKLYITDAEIRNKMTIGNPDNGYFDFIPRKNGNLSVKWRGN
jgi:phage minor structural protein